ncbi:TPA: hypothetical protein QC072_003575 [Bacillus cereus]|uniref:hypothetical protein n=1 Tax=Bacillus cereus group TaxID=86661 RepID=UPI000C28D5D5|nr:MULTISPECIES: hypothetical protein [Bacillus cereus group]KAA0750151.1 hypothetical protein DN401_25855 [Bacillus sp. BF2-3]MCA1002777.1 hypothetical protein [Bacillus thuringiensis]MCU5042886.1 hypothetical protein [Bacillus cereus]MDA2655899.1 hypothetical protein [Bacillus cereus]HDR8160689.1 hypothetical protein [Bacillus cereus]
MAYYENEILKELTVGETYTEGQIADLLQTDRTKSLILCDSLSRFDPTGNAKFKVIDRYDTYIHKNDDFAYHIPSRKTIVYIVKKV